MRLQLCRPGQQVYSGIAIVKFREYLEQLMEKKEPMFTTFPEEHMPLIAKLAHERCVLNAQDPIGRPLILLQ